MTPQTFSPHEIAIKQFYSYETRLYNLFLPRGKLVKHSLDDLFHPLSEVQTTSSYTKPV